MNATEFLAKLPAAFRPEKAAAARCVIQFNASSQSHVVIKDGTCSYQPGPADAPDLTVIMEDEDLILLMTGQLDGMAAFMNGRLQLEGDMMLAQNLGAYFSASRLRG